MNKEKNLWDITMVLVIEDWWNKVEPDSTQHFGTKVLQEFILKNRTKYPNNGGWKSKDQWKREIQKRHDFEKWIDGEKAKLKTTSFYGIKSYQIVYMES